MFVYTRMLDSGVLIWRTQPYSSSIGIICISQLISTSTPGMLRRGEGDRSTTLEAGSHSSAPQSSLGRDRSQPSGGKQVRVESRVGDPPTQKGSKGCLNLKAQQAPSYRRSLLRLRALESWTIKEETGMQGASPWQGWELITPGVLPPHSDQATSQPPWLSSSRPLPQPFPNQVRHSKGFTPAKDLAFSWLCWLARGTCHLWELRLKQ